MHESDLACLQLTEHLAQGGHVEHVLKTFTRRLEQDREGRVLRRHSEQIGGALALLPERRAPVGPAPGEQQGAGGALPEAGREQRRLGQLGDHDLVDLVGRDHERLDVEIFGRLRQADHDPVVAPHRLDREVVAVEEALLDRHRPGGVDRCAERAEDAHPPVADLVAEALDDDRAVIGHGAGGRRLLGQVESDV